MRTIKRIVIILMLLAVCLPLFATADSYDAAVREIVETFTKVLGSKTAVAFVSMESDSEGFSQRFVSDIERNLVNNDVIVLDRSNIDAIVKELEFQTSGLVDDDQAVSIGHMLGAQMIISAKASNMVSSYHVDIQLIDIETTLVKRHLVYDLKYDQNLRNIINGTSDNIGSQKIGIGLRGGMSIEFNKAHEDMVGTGPRPAEESPKGFVPTLTAFYRVTDTLKVQLELSYLKNGIDVYGFYDDYSGYTLDIDVRYSTLDIPVLVAWNFIQKPVSVDIFGGAYVSIPVSTCNISYDIEGYGNLKGSVDVTGVCIGVVGGFDAGFRVGPGNVVVDARFFYDLMPSKAQGELLGDEPQGLIYRKGIVVSAGYIFEI